MPQTPALTTSRPKIVLKPTRKRFEDMSKAELVEALQRNQNALRLLKMQQRAAQAEVATNGKYMESAEYNQLLADINAKTGVVQLIQSALTRLKNSGPTLDSCFMLVARRKLDPALFEDILAEANLARTGNASNLDDATGDADDDQPPSTYRGQS